MLADFKCDEAGRQLALDRLEVLDTAPEEPFENIVSLVQDVLHVPIATVALVDSNRQWFKARRGLEVGQTARDIAFCDKTIGKNRPLVIPETRSDPQFCDNPLVVGAPYIRSYLGIPLTTPDGYAVGTLCAIDTKPRDFSGSDVSILENFAKLVVGELELRQIASTDHLTGALARRAWFEAAQAEVSRAARHGRPLSFLILDIDKFKTINDRHGHPVGDQVIRSLAQTVSENLRQTDSFGRFGGEEFVLAMPETTRADACVLAERLRRAIKRSRIANPADLAWTASIGVADLLPGEHTVMPALERADQALYRAKAGGRDQVQADDARDRAAGQSASARSTIPPQPGRATAPSVMAPGKP